jgi:hypothetical protein
MSPAAILSFFLRDTKLSTYTHKGPSIKSVLVHEAFCKIHTSFTPFTLSRAVELETRVVELESESEGTLGGVGIGKNVPTPTLTSI